MNERRQEKLRVVEQYVAKSKVIALSETKHVNRGRIWTCLKDMCPKMLPRESSVSKEGTTV